MKFSIVTCNKKFQTHCVKRLGYIMAKMCITMHHYYKVGSVLNTKMSEVTMEDSSKRLIFDDCWTSSHKLTGRVGKIPGRDLSHKCVYVFRREGLVMCPTFAEPPWNERFHISL